MAVDQKDSSKFHHYVPQFILRKFSSRSRKRQHYIKVFDKSTGRSFESNVNQICGETHFNRVKLQVGEVCIEDTTQAIDSIGSSVLEKIISERGLHSISPEERAKLAIFIALQLTRGTGSRNMTADVINQMRSLFVRRFGEDNLPPELKFPAGEIDKKLFDLRHTVMSLNDLALALSQKILVLFHAPRGHNFILGDNPVTIANSQPNDGFWGNLGVLCKGSEIYMPISPEISLGLWCPTIYDEISASIKSTKRNLSNAKAIKSLIAPERAVSIDEQIKILERSLEFLEGISSCIKTGSPILMSSDNILHQNSLQVSHSERYLMSQAGDFSLVTDMLKASPRYVHGRRMLVN